MTAVLDASHEIIDCPQCKGKVKVEVEREPATVKVNKGFTAEDLEPIIERAIEKKMPKQKEEPAKPKDPEIHIPSYMPKHVCKGKGCEGHENKGYRLRVKKKCTNCDQFASENTGKCTWCGQNDFDDVDDDTLDDLGIPKPEHDHGDHE